MVDPDDGVRRAAAVANLQDVLEALMRQSLASGRLRIVEQPGMHLIQEADRGGEKLLHHCGPEEGWTRREIVCNKTSRVNVCPNASCQGNHRARRHPTLAKFRDTAKPV